MSKSTVTRTNTNIWSVDGGESGAGRRTEVVHTVFLSHLGLQIPNLGEGGVLAAGAQEISQAVTGHAADAAFVEEGEGFFEVGALRLVRHGRSVSSVDSGSRLGGGVEEWLSILRGVGRGAGRGAECRWGRGEEVEIAMVGFVDRGPPIDESSRAGAREFAAGSFCICAPRPIDAGSRRIPKNWWVVRTIALASNQVSSNVCLLRE